MYVHIVPAKSMIVKTILHYMHAVLVSEALSPTRTRAVF